MIFLRSVKSFIFRENKYKYCFNLNRRWFCVPVNNQRFSTAYNSKEVESGKYEKWMNELTTGKKNGDKPKFCMLLPPPNVTGNLHLGHSLMCTIQDVICRRKLQQGYQVIWIPGVDHAGIATQVIVEKFLKKKRNLSKHDLGREKFIEEVWKWKEEKHNHIRGNLKRMGCLLDWKREYFTLDEIQTNAVKEVFVQLFEEGLIYRSKSLVNWSCALQSTISDIEVESMEINGPTEIHVPGHEKSVTFGQMFDIAYKIENEKDDEIIVSTTRPETLLGDVAVAVHPQDERYSKYHGRPVQLWHPFRKERIPLIFDETVEKEFGTGAVKITPAHDKHDYEIAKRHSLKSIDVFTEDGRILDDFNLFSNLPRFEARVKIVESLMNLNLYRGVKPHSMLLPKCSRSNDIIEYMLYPQWFLKCDIMAKNAMKSVEDRRIKIYPKTFENNWFRWLSECRDWCISRQLWWGHKIPVYECTYNETSKWLAAISEEEALNKAQKLFNLSTTEGIAIKQDSDVLDTWFSSALLPFSVFNWPNEEYKEFYPLNIMQTGHDILFFWVARMVMLGEKITNEIPFRNILLNGIVCDSQGRKMSKSLGNVILPEQIIHGSTFEELEQEIRKSDKNGILSNTELKKSLGNLKVLFPSGIPECGTDALRLTLCSQNVKSHYINFDVFECHTNRLFLNKIWQATRYTLNAFEKLNFDPNIISFPSGEFTNMDLWILSKLANTRKTCNINHDSYNFHIAVSALRRFFYTNFCDVYLETTKPRIVSNDLQEGMKSCAVLSMCLSLGLQALSPFAPFISEELLKCFPKYSEHIDCNYINDDLEKEIEDILNVCTAIRQLKSQHLISKRHEPKVHLFPENNNALKLLHNYKDDIKVLSLSHDVILENTSNHRRKNEFNILSTAQHFCSFGISTNEKFEGHHSGKVLNRKKLEKLQKDLNKLVVTTSNEGYKNAASEDVQKKHREKIKQLQTEIANIKNISQ